MAKPQSSKPRAQPHAQSKSKRTQQDAAENDAVGYGKPPKATQFKKGRSGNPRGRPKGSLNLDTVVTQALGAKVVVTEGGRRIEMSKLAVAITQVANKAASGDLKATQIALNLWPLVSATVEAPLHPDLQADRAQARRIAARLARGVSGTTGENDDE